MAEYQIKNASTVLGAGRTGKVVVSGNRVVYEGKQADAKKYIEDITNRLKDSRKERAIRVKKESENV